MLRTEPSFFILGKPERSNRKLWALGYDYQSSRVIKPYDGSGKKWKNPGIVVIIPPGLRNGHGLYDSENALVAQEYLLTIAEELYHVSQALADPKSLLHYHPFLAPSAVKSRYFKDNPHRIVELGLWDEGNLTEADVYAKLLEVFGSEAVGHDLACPDCPLYRVRSRILHSGIVPLELKCESFLRLIENSIDRVQK